METNKIYTEDCRETLKRMPEQFINCCVTSPPYYGLRDYGHEGQIGLEETPEHYVQKLVEVFRLVREKMKDDGTLWLNLGDSYATGTTASRQPGNKGIGLNGDSQKARDINRVGTPEGLKTKDLIGIPWMVAFALRADGWYLRQDIIWHKPNPMPESVTDRCTKSHEYIFLLSKSQRYYYHHKAIQERAAMDSGFAKQRIAGNPAPQKTNGYFKEAQGGSGFDKFQDDGYRNKRSVWTVTTKPFKEAHFATFPEDLIVPCIKAGCPEKGIVYDPFMGAATTALVSLRANRQFVGSELNPDYVKIGMKRIMPLLTQYALF